MIIVTNVETRMVERDIWAIDSFDKSIPASPEREAKVTSEVIHGRYFIDPVTGNEVCIGLSKEASEALCFPFEVIENLQRDLKACQHHGMVMYEALQLYRDRVRYYESLSIWGLIKLALKR